MLWHSVPRLCMICIGFLLCMLGATDKASAQIYINEFSNGTGGAKEFYELVVDGPPGGFQDLRGWILDDQSGFFGCASGNGIASGHLRFALIANWACVRSGSIILIYNPSDPNVAITMADDFTDANNDYLYVLPISATGMFDISTSAPSSSNCNNFSGPFSSSGMGTSWNSIALGNGGDAAQTVDPANTTLPFHAVSYGGVSNPAPIHFSGSGSATNYSFSNTSSDDYSNPVNWASGSASTQDSPGMANNPANEVWIQSLRAFVAQDSLTGCAPFASVLEVEHLHNSLTASWDFGDGNSTLGDSVAHTYASNGSYDAVVTISNGSGCSYVDSAYVEVTSLNATFAPLADVCENATPVSLSGNPAGGVFLGNGVSGNSFQPAVAGPGNHVLEYAVTLGNCSDTTQQSISVLSLPEISIQDLPSNLPCEGIPVQLTAQGGDTPTWSTGEIEDEITIGASGLYWVALTNQCGTSADSVVVSLKQPPSASIGFSGPSAICEGESVTLLAAGGDQYAWSTGEQASQVEVLAAGVYSVTVSNECGDDSTSIEVVSKTISPYSLMADRVELCSGETAFAALDGGPFDVLWSNGSTTNSIYITEPGIYSVTFSDDCATRSDTLVIAELPAPRVNILEEGPMALCPGEIITLNAEFLGDFQWDDGTKESKRMVSQAGVFRAWSTNACGLAEDSIQVTMTDLEGVEFVQNPTDAVAPATVEFEWESDSLAGTFHWVFADGSEHGAANDPMGSRYFEEGGEYVVEFFFDDGHGCALEKQALLVIQDPTRIYFPNAFSPDGDLMNDLFQIKGIGVYEFEMEIYDRWGHLLHQWTGLEDGWDGTFNGLALPVGIYAYSYSYKNGSGRFFSGRGSVTLLR